MRFEILNVEHGFCAYAVDRDGNAFLFDCGHGPDTRPSTYLPDLGIHRVHRFFITNFNEDYIGDLVDLRRCLTIDSLVRNYSLTGAQIQSLQALKSGPAMDQLLHMIDTDPTDEEAALFQSSGLKIEIFSSIYPSFTNANNLSLLVFIDIGNRSFVLGGDMQRAGWLQMLQNQDVRKRLESVDIFVATHHGQQRGYCREVFEYCKPKLVVISDGPSKRNSQPMVDIYSQYASGDFCTTQHGPEMRNVVTTRNDGNIFWSL